MEDTLTVASENGVETKVVPINPILALVEADEASPISGDQMLFSEFVALLSSCLDVQSKVVREVSGDLINSLPIDMDLELCQLISFMQRINDPYDKARLNYAKGLGYKVDSTTNRLVYPESKNGLGREAKQEYTNEKLRKSNELEEAMAIMNETPIKEDDHKKLKAMLPLKTFVQKRIEDSGIIFKNCSLRQAFLKHCVGK